MADNDEALKTAQRMIDRYGADAGRQVDERINELNQSEEDYADEIENWRGVREAVLNLLSKK